jgi:cytochrome b subunit of formate dehydrogenase
MIYKGGHIMKSWFLETLDSPYKEWIMFSITLILTTIGATINWVKNIKEKHKKKKLLPWIGRIEGIDKDKKRNMRL